jgi:hypothetical protein
LYGNLPDGYYSKAIKDVNQLKSLDATSVVLFSDDTQKGKEVLERIGINNENIFTPEHLSPAQELFLLSKFKKIVLSNSTFSWWAGYFAENYAHVIAPDPLYKNLDTNLSRSPNWDYGDAWG